MLPLIKSASFLHHIDTQRSKKQLSNSFSLITTSKINQDEEIKNLVKSASFSGGKFSSNNLINKGMLNYFAEHISNFIDLALYDTETMYGKKAFIILSNGPSIITNALTKDFTFFIKVTELLQSPSSVPEELNHCTINRIATIFQNLIFSNEQNSIDSIGFLTQLLPYIEEDAVFELFHVIFTNKSKLRQMQIILSTINIDTFILNEMNSLNEASNTNFFSYSKIFNLLAIIRDGLANQELRNSFQNMNVLNNLLSMAKDTNIPLLLNNIWASFVNFADINSLLKMKNVFNEAMKVISQQFESLHPYHIFIFDFLTIAVDNDALMFSSSQKKQICQIIQNLMVKFPNSTNLIASMTNFIRKSFHNREFAQKILDNYISFFVELGKNTTRTAASANALTLLSELDSMKITSYMVSKSLSRNHKYTNFYKSFFKKYLEELPKQYGGNVQRYSLTK